LAPRPGLEPGTCGLTERRSGHQYFPSNYGTRSLARILFFRRYPELRPLAVRCGARIEPADAVRRWALIRQRSLGPLRPGSRSVPARQVLDAVLWILNTGDAVVDASAALSELHEPCIAFSAVVRARIRSNRIRVQSTSGSHGLMLVALQGGTTTIVRFRDQGQAGVDPLLSFAVPANGHSKSGKLPLTPWESR
jgi:hypothetical protein